MSKYRYRTRLFYSELSAKSAILPMILDLRMMSWNFKCAGLADFFDLRGQVEIVNFVWHGAGRIICPRGFEQLQTSRAG
jgi:hypothetical protein